MEPRVSWRPFKLTSAAALLDGQDHCANTQTPVPPTHVPTAASAPPLNPTTSAPAHLSSLGKTANRTSTSATRTPRPARTAACATTRWAGTGVSAPWSSPGNTARLVTCPVIPRPALTEEPASRKETPATSAHVYQVLTGKTATSTLTTVPATSVRMGEPA